MNKRTDLWPRMAAVLVITLAIAVTWGFASVWIGYLASQLWLTNDQVNESIQVRTDGTPLITSYSHGTVFDQSYRTLDGKPVEVASQQEWLAGTYFTNISRSKSRLEKPISWPERLAATSNYQRPPTGWYLVRDDEPLGHAYLVGYDEASRLRVGYIGRGGFRPALPPRDEWFDIGRHRFTWGGGVVFNSGNLQFGTRAYAWPIATGETSLPPWLLFVIDGDQLLEIDLRARSVRSLLETPGMLAAAVVNEPLPSTQVAVAAQADPPAAAEAETAEAAAPALARRNPLPQRVAIQMADRIAILDPLTGNKREYTLPESLRNRYISVCVVNDNQLLVQWWKDEGIIRGDTELTWLRPDGTIARELSVALARPPQLSEREVLWMTAATAPVPIGCLFVAIVAAPLGMLQSNQAASYAEAVANTCAIGWPPLLTVMAVGVALAWLTYHLQRKYRRSATGAWVTFVLLLGVPGFLAYWLEHRKPKLESCAACGEIVPRDREACAACDTQFPTPPLVGTEIFA